jgi:uncharacterized protein (TIRG00374 family)
VDSSERKTAYLIFFIVLGLVFLVLATAAITDGPKLAAVVNQLKLGPVLFALIAAAISYLSIALSFSALFELTKHRIRFSTMFSITFVAATFNYIVSTAGASSLAVRSYLFKQQHVPYATTLPLSIAQSMITNAVLALFCLGGLGYLHAHPEMVGGTERTIITGLALILLALVLLMAAVFFHPGSRKRILDTGVGLLGRLGKRVFKNKLTSERLSVFRRGLDESIQLLHRGWLQLLVALFWVAVDWGFTAMTLYFCFQAVEVKLTLGLVMVGFSVAFLTSTINVVPAGLGITELAVTGTFMHLTSVSAEKAVIAMILFRVVYFLFPLAVSTALYLDTMQKAFKIKKLNN